jgi:hypothetical protein
VPSPHRAPIRAACLAASLLLPIVPVAARAQMGGGDGFRFRQPVGSFTLRAGYDQALANSDVFDFVQEQLTLGRSSFGAPSYGADLAFALTPRLDLALSAGVARSTARSEDRRFIGVDDVPVAQETRFMRLPVGATLRGYLTPRGRALGRFAWVPNRVAPFVGVGGGALWYRFRQSGEFVDADRGRTFFAEFNSQGWTPSAHGLAGVEVALTPGVALTTEARYTWARARLSDDFAGFAPADLSGLQATAGVSLRF